MSNVFPLFRKPKLSKLNFLLLLLIYVYKCMYIKVFINCFVFSFDSSFALFAYSVYQFVPSSMFLYTIERKSDEVFLYVFCMFNVNSIDTCWSC